MNILSKLIFTAFAIIFIALSSFSDKDSIHAQDIPELHMLVMQGDIFIAGAKNSNIDGLILTAKIGEQVVGSVEISKSTASSRYVSLEIGPDESLEGKDITFWIGNQMASQSRPFGPLTPSGTYCTGCSWVLPISADMNLNFSAFPQATPTPIPESAAPAFITGNVIFGSILSAPNELTEIYAYIDDELVGTGTVKGPDFSITVDPGTVDYIDKNVVFVIGGTNSKTSYKFQADDFITDYKLFFPEYIPPTPTPTAVPLATAIPTATSTPEPTRTPTPVPEPTPTYTPTPTPTPIILSSAGSDSNNTDLVLADSSDGGCNSRGGGPASVSLILLSLVPAYVLKRKRRNI